MKRTYKLRNWSEYNAALVKRGSLTLWLSDQVIAQWKN
ncbi:MAG: IS5 family transposase, partial [Cyanobacteria bacterium P01_H01_bin.21]